MPKLYVLVHPTSLDTTPFSESVEKIRKKIKQIEIEKPFIKIGYFDDQRKIHPLMPPPHENLFVEVCGAFYGREDFCVNQQRTALKNAGYNVSINVSSSLKYNHSYK